MTMRKPFALLLCLVNAGLITAAWAEPVLVVDPDAREKRDAILAWSESLHSFSGSYTRTFINHDPSLPNLGVPDRSDITYRFEGDKKCMDFYSYLLKNHDRCSYVEGHFVQLLVMDEAPKATVTSNYFVKRLEGEWKPSWPEEMILPPKTAFLQDDIGLNMSLTEFFAAGHTLLDHRDGKEVLVHRDLQGARVEIEMDEFNHVSRILLTTDWQKEDIAPYYTGDALDLHCPEHAWRYKDYEDINGVSFPMLWEWIFYTGGAARSAIMKRRNAGEIDPYAAEMEIATTVKFVEQCVTTIQYDRASLIINEPLDADMFHVDVPWNALELDNKGVVIADESPTYLKSGPWKLPALLMFLLVLLIAGGVLYGRRLRVSRK
jgi:hypothetical protein